MDSATVNEPLWSLERATLLHSISAPYYLMYFAMFLLFCRVDNQLGRVDGILSDSGLLRLVSGTSAVHILRGVDSLLRHYLCTSGEAPFTLNEYEGDIEN